MALTRALVTAIAFLVFVGGSIAAAGKDYPGGSQALAPTPKEIGYSSVVSFKRATKPAAAEAKGWKNGVVALYAKDTSTNPPQAIATIHVYTSAANAKLAYAHACGSGCTSKAVYKGIAMKSGTTSQGDLTSLSFFANCRNVTVSLVAAGEPLKTQYNDAGVIAGWVFKRAMGMGMSACK